jgi:hypothetical protein
MNAFFEPEMWTRFELKAVIEGTNCHGSLRKAQEPII